jgi:plastocyanin
MLARLGIILRLAFPVELALAFTAAIFLLGFVTAMSAAPVSSSAQTQQASVATATASPTAATSGSTVTGETVAPATAATITMDAQGASFVFAPATLTIHAGTTVTWKNTSTVPHTVVGPGFDSGVLMAGQSFTHTFTQTGTFAYTCTIHPGMAATIRVVP